jgi:hypothetical protein
MGVVMEAMEAVMVVAVMEAATGVKVAVWAEGEVARVVEGHKQTPKTRMANFRSKQQFYSRRQLSPLGNLQQRHCLPCLPRARNCPPHPPHGR